ncbi:CGNR zinc finger domain-containing protein [Lentzea sp. NPDC034063]|uniref:CGNR zinc finger domain-containing protein n=1 Tax=unclassified Lentzea TaxID=2643253 RepID=UPI0033D7DC66
MLLDLLNTTPVLDDGQHDVLAEEGLHWLTAHDQPSSDDELRALIAARDALQAVVRGQEEPAALAPFVEGVRQRAGFGADGVTWELDLPEGRTAAAQAVLAWDELRRSSPGRVRPCENPDCRLFLIDHSKPNSARWCSMAVCGNRMKARRHYQRTRGDK